MVRVDSVRAKAVETASLGHMVDATQRMGWVGGGCGGEANNIR